MRNVARTIEPQRPATWLLGSSYGVQVWTIAVSAVVRASVLISADPAVIVVNESIVGTPLEGAAVLWAFQRIAEGQPGFYLWRD